MFSKVSVPFVLSWLRVLVALHAHQHLVLVSVVDFGPSNRCVLVSRCFTLHFPDDIRCGTSFHRLFLVCMPFLVRCLRPILKSGCLFSYCWVSKFLIWSTTRTEATAALYSSNKHTHTTQTPNPQTPLLTLHPLLLCLCFLPRLAVSTSPCLLHPTDVCLLSPALSLATFPVLENCSGIHVVAHTRSLGINLIPHFRHLSTYKLITWFHWFGHWIPLKSVYPRLCILMAPPWFRKIPLSVKVKDGMMCIAALGHDDTGVLVTAQAKDFLVVLTPSLCSFSVWNVHFCASLLVPFHFPSIFFWFVRDASVVPRSSELMTII